MTQQQGRPLVLDANILIRPVLGTRVRALLREHVSRTAFLAPEDAFAEARRHLPGILMRRGAPPDRVRQASDVLESLTLLVTSLPIASYAANELEARARLIGRDEADWPVLAAAHTLSCPIWTEDYDFFGTGVATWTSDRVRLYLER